jgi:hypothetical protein
LFSGSVIEISKEQFVGSAKVIKKTSLESLDFYRTISVELLPQREMFSAGPPIRSVWAKTKEIRDKKHKKERQVAIGCFSRRVSLAYHGMGNRRVSGVNVVIRGLLLKTFHIQTSCSFAQANSSILEQLSNDEHQKELR